MHSFTRPGLLQPDKIIHWPIEARSWQRRIAPLLLPLLIVGFFAGFFLLEPSLRPIALGVAAGAVLGGAGSWLLLQRKVMAPLTRLHQAIGRAERGEWERIAAERGGPMSEVVDSFNRMVESVAAQARQQRDAIAQAEQAAHAKDSFLAHVSHELRTPLNAIIGFSEVMRAEIFGSLGSERYRGYAMHIHESGSHLLEIINEILDLSKVEAGKFELSEEPFALAPALDVCMRLIQPQARRQDIEILADIEPDLPWLFGDEVRVKQIVFNLLSNAVKFTPRGGKVSVAARRAHHGGLVITVEDNGIGMASEDIPRALAPFGQIESEMWKTREGSGTGLGLPLVKAFAELHGASFAIDSARGVGTAVTVSFPAARLLGVGAHAG
jgi:signal transduction histidine kinase